MSKKKRVPQPEIPLTGNALEVPNYVIPTTDLESLEINNEVDPRDEEDLSREEAAKHSLGQ